MTREAGIFLRAKKAHAALHKLPGVLTVSKELSFDDCVHDAELRRVARKLFNDGHYARAVEEAYKYFNNLVKKRTGSPEDGSKLMEKVFSSDKPVIMLNPGKSDSEKNEQLGYLKICSGVMTGIRNPRAHETEQKDTRLTAMQLLMFADHLICKVREAECHPRRSRAKTKQSKQNGVT